MAITPSFYHVQRLGPFHLKFDMNKVTIHTKDWARLLSDAFWSYVNVSAITDITFIHDHPYVNWQVVEYSMCHNRHGVCFPNVRRLIMAQINLHCFETMMWMRTITPKLSETYP